MTEQLYIAHYLANRYQTPHPCAHYDDLYSEALLWLCVYGDAPHLRVKVQRRVVDYLRKLFKYTGPEKTYRPRFLPYYDSGVEPTQEAHTDHVLRLERLTGKQQAYFTRFMYGESMQEIGESVGVSAPAVCYHIKRAKQRYAA